MNDATLAGLVHCDIVPRRIGLCAVPTQALILVYTTAGDSKCRKRIMPLRSLHSLGARACAQLMVDAHRPFLHDVSLVQIEDLICTLMQTKEATEACIKESVPLKDSCRQLTGLEFKAAKAPEHTPEDAYLSLSEVPEPDDPIDLESDGIEQRRASASHLEIAGRSTERVASATYTASSKDHEKEKEKQVEGGNDGVVGAFRHRTIAKHSMLPPASCTANVPPLPANVAGLQACLDRAMLDLQASDGCTDGCASPGSVLDFRPLSACLRSH